MLTTLNLTLASQTTADTGLLPGETGGETLELDAATFAATLDLSLDQDLPDPESGNLVGSPLPLAGIELPVLADSSPSSPEPAEPGPVISISEGDGVLEHTDLLVDWPPGLEPTVSPDAPVVLAPVRTDALHEPRPDLPLIVTPPAPPPAAPTGTETTVVAARAAPVISRNTDARPQPAVPRAALDPVVADGERALPGIMSERREPPAAEQPARYIVNSGATATNSSVEPAVPQRAPEWSTNIAAGNPDSNVTTALAIGGSNGIERASTARTAPTLPAISTPVGDPGFDDGVADRVLLMASNRLGNAEIRLTPAELGPVRVQVTVDEGTANVHFHAAQAATREALEQAMPRLRELLAENGLSLGQANVNDDGSRSGVRDQARSAGDGSQSETSGDDVEAQAGTDAHGNHGDGRARVSNGLVDTFA